MKFRIVCICIGVLVVLNGCKNKENVNCTITIDELLDRNYRKVFGTGIANNGKIIEFRDKGTDSIVSGYYSFYNNRHLKSYHFFSDRMTYLYHEEYDSAGTLLNVEGNPLVLNIANRVSIDSILINLYFFSMNKLYEDLNVRTMANKVFSVKLVDDTLYSNMKRASFGINFKGYTELRPI